MTTRRAYPTNEAFAARAAEIIREQGAAIVTFVGPDEKRPRAISTYCRLACQIGSLLGCKVDLEILPGSDFAFVPEGDP